MRVAQLDRGGLLRILAGRGRSSQRAQRNAGARSAQGERRARFMELAAQISAKRLEQKVGRTMPVLIDRIERDPDSGGDVAIARSSSDAPEIDGTVRIVSARGSAKALVVGSLVDVRITAAGDYVSKPA